MKLKYTHQEFSALIEAKSEGICEGIIDAVAWDSRLIVNQKNLVFFALTTPSNDGHKYVAEAYEKGVRAFVVSKKVDLPEDVTVFSVENTLSALQVLAYKHRLKFNIPIIAIAGGYGKTIAKEWLYFLLKEEFTIVRSPKSYNTALGIALSILEINEQHTLGIFEVGISKPDEMQFLEQMVDPTLGVFTGTENAAAINFDDEKQRLNEKLKLFRHANFVFTKDAFKSVFRRNKLNGVFCSDDAIKIAAAANTAFKETLAICIETALFYGIPRSILEEKVAKLPAVSSRLEVLEGVNNNTLINDTYSLDENSLRIALTYLSQQNEKEKKFLVLNETELTTDQKEDIVKITSDYTLDGTLYVTNDNYAQLDRIENSYLLFKGNYQSTLKSVVNQCIKKKHETWLEVNQSKIASNINVLKSNLKPETKVLAMLKASSYGSGDVKMAHFLAQRKIDYFGVAYADEGVALRNKEIDTPTIVMNAERNAFKDIILYQLEPAIYSLGQLEDFIHVLIQLGVKNYPIHIKLESGMNRLGFLTKELSELVAILNTQPEVYVKSIFSHLATAGSDDEYVHQQVERFTRNAEIVLEELDEEPWLHILNSEGIQSYPQYQMGMVRLGIAMYGIGSNPALKEVLRWYSRISQIKEIKAGETIGYGRAFTAEKEMKIAIIPVGYSDGFRRSLGNGVGEVVIQDKACPVVGNVCMDMCMVDVSAVSCTEGDIVELLGYTITLKELAQKMNTIPYELMTGISKRVPRVYIKQA
ncbi:MAG: alanine racemase [Lishizhenia sp.]